MVANRSLKNLSILLATCFLFWLKSQSGKALASFSIDDRKKLGREFYEKLEKANALSKNERATAFLSLLGERILSHSDKVLFEFKFSIIQSSAINAFATPGGYVYINQGLINLVEKDEEPNFQGFLPMKLPMSTAGTSPRSSTGPNSSISPLWQPSWPAPFWEAAAMPRWRSPASPWLRPQLSPSNTAGSMKRQPTGQECLISWKPVTMAAPCSIF